MTKDEFISKVLQTGLFFRLGKRGIYFSFREDTNVEAVLEEYYDEYIKTDSEIPTK